MRSWMKVWDQDKRWANPVGKNGKGIPQGTHRCVSCGKIHNVKEYVRTEVKEKK